MQSTSHHHNHHPLLIPELLLNVGLFLDRQSLLSSLRVSRAWHACLHPLLWHDLEFCIFGDDQEPDSLLLQKNASRVRNLSVLIDTDALRRDLRFFNLDNNGGRCGMDVHELDPSELGPDENNPHRLFRFQNLLALKIGLNDTPKHGFEGHIWIEKAPLDFLKYAFSSLDNSGLDRLQRLEINPFYFMDPEEWMVIYEQYISRMPQLRVLILKGDWCRDHKRVHKKKFRQKKLFHPDKMEHLAQTVKPLRSIEELVLIAGYHRSEHLFQVHCWMIQQCPNLRRLRWTYFDEYERDTEAMRFLAETITRTPSLSSSTSFSGSTKEDDGENSLPLLQQLETICLPWMEFNPEDFPNLVQVMPLITKINLRYSNFEQEQWRVLREITPRHLSTISIMKVDNCVQLPSSSIQEMLCSLPSLRILHADQVFASDLITKGWRSQDDGDVESENKRPPSSSWVCLGLRELSLTFKLQESPRTNSQNANEKDNEERQQIVFQDKVLGQLARLLSLEVLRLDNSDIHVDLNPAREGRGLDRLHTLERLREFRGEYRHLKDCSWGQKEIEWVLRHWPKIEEIRGPTFQPGIKNPF